MKFANLPNVKSVGVMSFNRCTSLENLVLPVAESVGGNCISGCASLKTISCGLMADSF